MDCSLVSQAVAAGYLFDGECVVKRGNGVYLSECSSAVEGERCNLCGRMVEEFEPVELRGYEGNLLRKFGALFVKPGDPYHQGIPVGYSGHHLFVGTVAVCWERMTETVYNFPTYGYSADVVKPVFYGCRERDTALGSRLRDLEFAQVAMDNASGRLYLVLRDEMIEDARRELERREALVVAQARYGERASPSGSGFSDEQEELLAGVVRAIEAMQVGSPSGGEEEDEDDDEWDGDDEPMDVGEGVHFILDESEFATQEDFIPLDCGDDSSDGDGSGDVQSPVPVRPSVKTTFLEGFAEGVAMVRGAVFGSPGSVGDEERGIPVRWSSARVGEEGRIRIATQYGVLRDLHCLFYAANSYGPRSRGRLCVDVWTGDRGFFYDHPGPLAFGFGVPESCLGLGFSADACSGCEGGWSPCEFFPEKRVLVRALADPEVWKPLALLGEAAIHMLLAVHAYRSGMVPGQQAEFVRGVTASVLAFGYGLYNKEHLHLDTARKPIAVVRVLMGVLASQNLSAANLFLQKIVPHDLGHGPLSLERKLDYSNPGDLRVRAAAFAGGAVLKFAVTLALADADEYRCVGDLGGMINSAVSVHALTPGVVRGEGRSKEVADVKRAKLMRGVVRDWVGVGSKLGKLFPNLPSSVLDFWARL